MEMGPLTKFLIKTAREFPDQDDYWVTKVAVKRMKRLMNRPVLAHSQGNNYQKMFSHFEGERPVFKWENFGDMR